jgi:hypothetical protein
MEPSDFGNHKIMRAQDALLVVREWLEKGSALYLSASTINFSAFAPCRVVAVEDDKVVLRTSAEHGAVFSFSVNNPLLSLRHAELRDLVGKPGFENLPKESQTGSALVVRLALEEIEPSLAPLMLDAEEIVLFEPPRQQTEKAA